MSAFTLTLLRAILLWLAIMAGESVHGALRRLLMDPETAYAVRQLSVAIGAGIAFGVTWLGFRWMGVRTARGALLTGAGWVVLTLAFELGLGRALGMSWAHILRDYDLTQGGLMPLGLLIMGLSPWAVRTLQDRQHAKPRRAS